MKTVGVQRLNEPYPPVNVFAADSQEILDQWEGHLKTRGFYDPRGNPGHRKIVLLDSFKLQYKVPEGENVVFRDAITGEVIGAVVQGMIDSKEIQSILDKSVIDHLNTVGLSMRVSTWFRGSRRDTTANNLCLEG
jgi:hypothetical protein